jgi:hypothetical protein
MSDDLPRLLPNDPQNLLSPEARKRIHRALVEAQKFIWKTEVAIETREHPLDWDSHEANSLRNKARFKNAKAALSVYRREFSRLGIPERAYRKFMKDEIEAASNSLQLTQAQQRLLETEFFYPEKVAQQRPSSTSRAPLLRLPAKETIATQIQRLRDECRWTIPALAEAADLSARQVARHLSGEFKPLARNISSYERAFSNHLKRKVVINKMS